MRKNSKGKYLTHSVRYVEAFQSSCPSHSPVVFSLGEEEKARRNPRFCNTDYVDGVDYPFAIFTFKYCLKSMYEQGGSPPHCRFWLTTK